MNNYTVLLVDDNEDDREIVRFHLNTTGSEYNFIEAEDAAEALQLLEGRRVDIVVSDYQMPGMNGIQLLEKIRSKGYEVPFILLTGQGSEEIACQALRAGVDDYHTKEPGLAQYHRLAHAINSAVTRSSVKKDLQRETVHNLAILDAIPDLIFRLKTDGTYLEVRTPDPDKLAVSEEELIGQNMEDVLPEEVSMLAFGAIEAACSSGQPQGFEYELKTVAGERLYFEGRMVPYGEEEVLCIVRDITERTILEQQSKEQDQRWRMMMNTIYEMALQISPEGNILAINPTGAERLGGTEAELLSKNFFDLLPPDLAQYRKKRFLEVIDSGRQQRHIYNYGGKTNDSLLTPLLNEHGDVSSVVIFSQDITERVQYENRLHRAVDDLNAVLEASGDGILVTDLNQNIIHCNSAFARLWDLEPEEVVGKRHADLQNYSGLKSQSPQEFVERLEEIYTDPEARVVDSLKLSDGRQFQRESSPYRVDGAIIGRVWTLHDVTETRNAQQKLAETRDLLKAVLDAIDIGVIVYTKDGDILYANDAAAEHHGMETQQELVKAGMPGISDRQVVYDEEGHRLSADEMPSRLAMQGESTIGKIFRMHLSDDDEPFWGILNVFPLIDAECTPTRAIISVQDITSLKESEQRISRFNQRLHAILENMSEGVLVIGADSTITFANEAAGKLVHREESDTLIGQRADEVLGALKAVFDDARPLSFNSLVDRMNEEDKTTITTLVEAALPQQEQTVWLSLQLTCLPGDPDEERDLLLTISDVTHQVEPQRRLKSKYGELEEAMLDRTQQLVRSRETLELAYKISNIGYWVWDLKSDVVTLSETMAEFMGLPRTRLEWPIEEMFPHVHPDDLQDMEEWIEELYKHTGSRGLNFRLKNEDGRIRYLRVEGIIQRDQEGNPLRILGVDRDETERIHTELELRSMHTDLEQRVEERTQQLQQANRELESFTYSVSHDLRSPLRHIRGFIEILEDELSGSSSSAQRIIDHVKRASESMDGLIQSLLWLSRATRMEPDRQTIDISAMSRSILSALQADDSGRSVIVEIEDGLTCYADRELISVLMENLLGNAWKYTALEEEARITVRQRDIDDMPVIEICDNGIGFDPADSEKILQPFVRLDNAAEQFDGAGIGMATVSRIIDRHKGTLWLNGSPGEGACIAFRL